MSSFLFVFFIISIFLEGTVAKLPFVFISLVILTIAMRNLVLFILAFFAGILLDAFALRPIGETSIFLLLCVFLMLLYQRKYEINSYPFVLLASFVGSLIYLLVFGYAGAIWLASLSTIVAVLLFMIFRIANFKSASQNTNF
jgi:cell shape-determining protein MreD